MTSLNNLRSICIGTVSIGLLLFIVPTIHFNNQLKRINQNVFGAPAVANAFAGGGKPDTSVVQKYNLSYQILTNGNISFSSDPALPVPKVLKVQDVSLHDVLVNPWRSAPPPYLVWKGLQPLVMRPFLNPTSPDSGYLVYAPAQ